MILVGSPRRASSNAKNVWLGMKLVLGGPFADAAEVLGLGATLPSTTILPSRISVDQHATGPSAGARTASPVRRLKQAWCQGQRTVSPTVRPSARGPW